MILKLENPRRHVRSRFAIRRHDSEIGKPKTSPDSNDRERKQPDTEEGRRIHGMMLLDGAQSIDGGRGRAPGFNSIVIVLQWWWYAGTILSGSDHRDGEDA
ncbi:hypothetical protein L1887_22317 [Cichorium endivia]|nr:hypothetical protein L1887_22317 [Cichorium endivia]